MGDVKLTDHHRKCKSNGGTKDKSNISRVPVGQHRSWHHLFRNFTPPMIAEIINQTWIDPEYFFVPVRKGSALHDLIKQHFAENGKEKIFDLKEENRQRYQRRKDKQKKKQKK